MARPSPLVGLSQYVALRTAASFFHSFGVKQNLQFAATVGSWFYRLSHRHRERLHTNLTNSYPDWPRERVAEISERASQHMFQLFMVDVPLTPRLVTESSWPKYLRIGRMQNAMDRLIRNEPMIVLTCHYGNWELLGYAQAVLGFPSYALARPLDNPQLNDYVMGIREARGMRIISKWGATPVLQRVLNGGGRVAFIADQNAGNQGMFVPFFGRLASSYKSIGLLAMHHEVPIVVGCARRLHGRYEYELSTSDIIEPGDWVDQPDPLYYITARYNRAMEHMIRAAPEQYLWVHRRWKSRPRYERLGRPVPERMIAKLEALPWMTTQDVDTVVERSRRDAAAASAAR